MLKIAVRVIVVIRIRLIMLILTAKDQRMLNLHWKFAVERGDEEKTLL